MSDAVAYPLLALLAAGLVCLALVWPQGQGARSPSPFGHPLALIAQPTAPAPTSSAPPAVKLRGAKAAGGTKR